MSVLTEDGDTIAAISTAAGEGGIAIIRISGDLSLSIGSSIFRTATDKKVKSFTPRLVNYGYIVRPTGEKIDEVLLTYMQGPKSYTCEDIIEISSHGGMIAARAILKLVTTEFDCRLARGGEFSKRAFINGRIDLVQAEAIIDIIKSRSDRGWSTAFSHLTGSLSKAIAIAQGELIDIIARLEVSLDFPDEVIDIIDDKSLLCKLISLRDSLDALKATEVEGKLYRDGCSAILIGRPNSGKSSLLNRLLGEDRAIVTDVAGTTRDIIEESFQIAGIEIKIIDSAGISSTTDSIEREGINRSLKFASIANLLLVVFDSSERLSSEDLLVIEEVSRLASKKILVMNKSDLPQLLSRSDLRDRGLSDPIVKVSAKTSDRLEELKELIRATIESSSTVADNLPVITRDRHFNLINETLNSIRLAIETVEKGLSREFVVADLESARYSIEELTGKNITEEALDLIFSEYCIGK
ncbi:MAG: tRNA uridine-5-carboxymethylaminomethyl(34) synthesis GTPase MnmE [Nitrospinota bacterium]